MTRQTVTHLGLEQILDHPDNVRDDLGDLTDLARSIREHGLLQPVTVTEAFDGNYVLLAGHRRTAAARLVGLSRIPVVIRHGVADKAAQLVLMLVENCQRRDLNPIEKAEAYGALRHRGLTMLEIAQQVGVSVATVSHYLTLLELPEDEREQLRAGTVTTAAAMAEVRQQRDQARKAERPTSGVRGRPKGAKTAPWFSDRHPLAQAVRRGCTHRGRKKVGGVGCGPCWEQAIRDGGELAHEDTDEHEVDEVLVQRILDGHYRERVNPAEKREVLRRWTAGGKSAADLGRLTGWRPERYFHASEHIEEAS